MRRLVLTALTVLIVGTGLALDARAQSTSVFEHTFTRGSGNKDVFEVSFSVSDPTIPYSLKIANGTAGGQAGGSTRVRKGWITLNGQALLDPTILRSQNSQVELAIHPRQQNVIDVKLKGGDPGSFVTVTISATQSGLLAAPGDPGFDASEAGIGVPYGVVIDQNTHTAFVADRYMDSVWSFDIQNTRLDGKFSNLDVGSSSAGAGGTTAIRLTTTPRQVIAMNVGITTGSEGSLAVINPDNSTSRLIPLLSAGRVLHPSSIDVNNAGTAAAFTTFYDSNRNGYTVDLSSGAVTSLGMDMGFSSVTYQASTSQFIFGAQAKTGRPELAFISASAPFRLVRQIPSTAASGTEFSKIAINTTTNQAIAVNPADASVSVFDLTAGIEIARIPITVGTIQDPIADVAVNPVTNTAVVVSAYTNLVSVIDLSTFLVRAELPLPQAVRLLGVDIDRQLNRAVITDNGLSSNTRNGSILVIQLPTP